MKRLSSLLASLLFAVTLATPQQAQALSWDWVPKVFKLENLIQKPRLILQPKRECKKRNSWGDCVIFSATVSKTR